MKSPELLKYRKVIATIALVCIVVHLLFCCFFTFVSNPKLTRTKVGIFYQNLVLLGPFFSEDRIQSSSHLYSRHKDKQGRWSAFKDNSEEYFNAYNHRPWQCSNLVLRDYSRYVLRDVSRDLKSTDIRSIKKTSSFKKLHRMLVHEGAQTGEVDSIQVMGILRWYIPTRNAVRMDTLFTIDYKPAEVESSQ